MNKLIILLLAVCLVSVHAYVKREVPETTEPALDKIKKQFDDLGKSIADTFNPDAIKETFSGVIDNVNKVLEGFKPTEAPKA